MTMPAKPIIEPTDRSNSPAIISSATGSGEDAELRRHFEEVDDALGAEQAAVAGGRREEHEHQDRAGHRAELRPAQQPAEQPRLADPLVREATVVMSSPFIRDGGRRAGPRGRRPPAACA